jgi:hypothetical protein
MKKLAGMMGVLPAIASGALGDENRGFALGLAPGLMYRNRQKKKGDGVTSATTGMPEENVTGMKKGGKVKKYAKGGTASKRADGCAVKGKTRGKMI